MIKILIKKIFESADAAIILSESWFDWHFTNISKKAKWIVLRNPSPLPQPLYKIKNNGKRISILYMSRLEKRKGVYDLIDILPEVIKKNNDSFFCFAGDGDFEKVRDLIHEKNLSNNAKAIGWIDDEKKVSLLRDTDIFVLPSYNEGLPMALLEAMTFGIPCIATNVGGIPELIQNKKNGLLFFPGDKKKLKLNLSILIQNSEIRNSIGKAAYQTIKKSYTLSSYVKKLTNLYFNL